MGLGDGDSAGAGLTRDRGITVSPSPSGVRQVASDDETRTWVHAQVQLVVARLLPTGGGFDPSSRLFELAITKGSAAGSSPHAGCRVLNRAEDPSFRDRVTVKYMGSAPGFWDGLRWSAASFSFFFLRVDPSSSSFDSSRIS